MSLNNIGTMYSDQEEYDAALEYQHKSLAIRSAINDQYGIANSSLTLGYILDKLGQLDSAMYYFRKAFKIQKKIDAGWELTTTLNNIAYIHDKKGNKHSAMFYYESAMQLMQEQGNEEGLSLVYNNLSAIYFEQGKIERAEQFAKQSLSIGKLLESPDKIASAAQTLNRIYQELGRYKVALEIYELHIQMRDSINNEETKKATIHQQTKYEFEKEQLLKEQELKEESRKLKEETERRDNLQYSIILVGIMAVFGLVLSLGFVSVLPKVAEGLIFFAFLILFEFLLVLSDPYLDRFTDREPMYKLLINALLAGFIFPMHTFFEKYLKSRLIIQKQKLHNN